MLLTSNLTLEPELLNSFVIGSGRQHGFIVRRWWSAAPEEVSLEATQGTLRAHVLVGEREVSGQAHLADAAKHNDHHQGTACSSNHCGHNAFW